MNVADPETAVWPARNVAEFAYCARLFYLMEVEGIHVASHDTEAGQRIHKRVNRPSAKKKADEAGEAVDNDRPHPGHVAGHAVGTSGLHRRKSRAVLNSGVKVI